MSVLIQIRGNQVTLTWQNNFFPTYFLKALSYQLSKSLSLGGLTRGTDASVGYRIKKVEASYTTSLGGETAL